MALEYMPRVLKETLRLYPPVWLFSRRAVGADRLGDYDVPAGSHIFISPWLLHRNTRFWDDPERFDPDRFAGPRRRGAGAQRLHPILGRLASLRRRVLFLRRNADAPGDADAAVSPALRER